MYHEKHDSSLVTLLKQSVEQRGSKIALEDDNDRVNYLELAQRIKSLAQTLIDEGLQSEQRWRADTGPNHSRDQPGQQCLSPICFRWRRAAQSGKHQKSQSKRPDRTFRRSHLEEL